MPPPNPVPIPIHRRTYDCEAFDDGDGRLRVRGRLLDTKPQGLGLADGTPLDIHDMEVDLVVDTADFSIVDVEARMNVHPYEVCTDVLPDYRKLIGLSVTRGYSRKVKELFGGPAGCSHVGALLIAMGPVAVQASWSLINLHQDLESRVVIDDSPEAKADRARRMRLNANTCHVWVEGGEQLTSVELGTHPMRPGWETQRLRDLLEGGDVDVGID